jgi:DNA-binding response OmpR family regulator
MTTLTGYHVRKANQEISCLYVDPAEGDMGQVIGDLCAGGYIAIGLGKGQDVKIELERRRYDILLMRLEMPDIDGIEVLKGLRRCRNEIPVILMTSHDDFHTRVAALNAGADDVVQTSLPFGELAARIRALLRRSSFCVKPVMDKDDSAISAPVDLLVNQLNKRLQDSGAKIFEIDGSYAIRATSSSRG